MADEKEKNEGRKVEWSFDFANISDSFNKMIESISDEEELTISEFRVAKADVDNARVNVKFSVAQGFIQAAESGSDDLFTANIHHVGELSFSEEGDAMKTVSLKQKQKIDFKKNPLKQGFRAFAHREDLKWNISLAPDVPISLSVNGGVGPTKLDLTGLNLLHLDVDTGVGTLDLILPDVENKLEVNLKGGIGETNVTVPDNADVMLNVNAGVGEVTVTVPNNAALQVQGKSGIGSFKVPKSLKRMSGKGMMDTRLWQSEGYDLADRRITIHMNGGVGQFKVKEAELV